MEKGASDYQRQCSLLKLTLHDTRGLESPANTLQAVTAIAECLLALLEFKEDIDTNRLFVYMVNGQMQAVFAFVLGEDPTYKVIEDGQWLNDTLPYGTLHRLASAGESKGIGKAVVEWCLEHCESLRADTHADNKVMQHLLESEGFTRCGIIHVEDGTPRIAYQRMSLTQSQLG